MSIIGMYVLNTTRYNQEKVYQALDMLYVDRKNQFRELSQILLSEKALKSMPNWKEFVLNFCLDVEEAFDTWSGKNSLSTRSPQKALTLLRQLGRGKTSMNSLTRLLNTAYDISTEFREIYRRLK